MKRVVPTQAPTTPRITDAVSLGKALRAARTAAGMRIIDAAGAMNIAKQTLIDLEKGVGTVKLETALKVANDLGVSVFAVPSAQRHLAEAALTPLLPKLSSSQEESPDSPCKTTRGRRILGEL